MKIFKFILFVGVVVGLFFGVKFLKDNGQMSVEKKADLTPRELALIEEVASSSAIIMQSDATSTATSTTNLNGQPKPIIPGKKDRVVFNWNYKGRAYNLSLALDSNVYQAYNQSPKVYQYYGDLPANWHDEYYKMFLTAKGNDTTASDVANQLRFIASKENLSDDEMVNLTMAFVQTIPYDKGKNLETGTPNYPYETLFTRLGVCSDKTFLAVMILRELGYGAAVMDFPDVNHAAVGIQCPDGYAVFNSGYCYAETTNFFPIGVIPRSIGKNGVVANLGSDSLKGQFADIFKVDQLGQPEIMQRTRGKEYRGIEETAMTVQKLILLETDLAEAKPKLDQAKNELDVQLAELEALKISMNNAEASGNIVQFNGMVGDYNIKVANYNNSRLNYNMMSDLYNTKVGIYNETIGGFYPSK